MSTLLLGQTDYFSEHDLVSVFTDQKIIAVGNLAKPSKKIRQFALTDLINFKTLFQSYDVEEIVYFSSFLNSLDVCQQEFQKLEELLKALIDYPEIKLIYVTGPDLNYTNNSSRRIAAQSVENLCHYYHSHYNVDLKIVRSLHLYSSLKSDDILGAMNHGGSADVELPNKVNPKQMGYFIYPLDLTSLLYRVFDIWTSGLETISIPNEFNFSYDELADAMSLDEKRREEIFDSNAPVNYLRNTADANLHERYGWFPKVSLLDDLPKVKNRVARTADTKFSLARLVYQFGEQKAYFKLVQTILFFLISEWLVRTLGQQVYFRMLDYRLLFVTLISLVFGTFYGLLAAVLASMALIYSNIVAGTSLSSLFFEPSNWVIYIVYFIIGSVGGSVRERAQDEVKTMNAQKENLSRQLDNNQEFIDDLLERQGELTNQIISRQDSYGQIYHFLNSLNTPYVDVFFMTVVQYMVDVFGTRSVRIYREKPEQGQALLQLAATRQGLQPTLDLDDYKLTLEQVRENRVWVNNHLQPELPMLISILENGEEPPLYIVINELPSSKMNLYYQNMFTVLTGLVQNAYQQLVFYNDQTKEERYAAKTSHLILKEDDFRRQLEVLEQLDIGHFKQRVFRVQAHRPQEQVRLAKLLSQRMTFSDFLGTLNGELYLATSSHTGMTTLAWEEFWGEIEAAVQPVPNLDEVLAKSQAKSRLDETA